MSALGALATLSVCARSRSRFSRSPESLRRSIRWRRTFHAAVRRLRSSEPVEIGDSLDRTFDHWFTEEEIRSELEEAGFETVFTATEPYGHSVGTATHS